VVCGGGRGCCCYAALAGKAVWWRQQQVRRQQRYAAQQARHARGSVRGRRLKVCVRVAGCAARAKACERSSAIKLCCEHVAGATGTVTCRLPADAFRRYHAMARRFSRSDASRNAITGRERWWRRQAGGRKVEYEQAAGREGHSNGERAAHASPALLYMPCYYV